MSALLRLYPKAWRERYAEEFAGLAEERPLTVRDRVDLVRGAWDAWRDPSMTPAAALAGGGTLVNVQARRTRTGTSRFTASLGLVSAALLALAALSTQVSWFPHLQWQLTNALADVATMVLGLAAWTIGPYVLARLAAVVLVVGGIAMLTWQNAVLAVALPLTAGCLVLAGSHLVHRRPGTLTALLAGGLSVAFWVAVVLDTGDVPSYVLMVFLTVPLALAVEARPGRRDVLAAALATVIGAVAVYAGATATSPRILHDGYGLRCSDVPVATCTAEADAFVATIRAADPAAQIGTVTISPYQPAWACGPRPAPVDVPCWSEPEPSAPEPYPRSITGTDAEPGVRP